MGVAKKKRFLSPSQKDPSGFLRNILGSIAKLFWSPSQNDPDSYPSRVLALVLKEYKARPRRIA